MQKKLFSLAEQIKKEIGNRVLFCSLFLIFIVLGLTIYDISVSVNQLPTRISPQLKPLEDFAMNQIMIDNSQTIRLKLNDFNENNPSFQVSWNGKRLPVFNKISWKFPLQWKYYYPLSTISGFQFGYFQVSGSLLTDQDLISDLAIRLGLLLAFILAIFSLLYPLSKKIPNKLFMAPVNRFLDLMSDQKAIVPVPRASLPIELTELETKISALLNSAKKYERNQAAIKIGHLAAQVAHDIRSPLAALNAMLRDTTQIPEQQRIMIRNASQRINDIANNLLVEYRQDGVSMQKDGFDKNWNNELISVVLDRMVSEKRAQYQDRAITLELTIGEETHGLFAKFSPPNLKRVLSNLINNAVEATKQNGLIQVELKYLDPQLYIIVSDTGCGMPAELQTKVLEGGTSIGKEGGTGIGLASSKRLIESWGGDLVIASQEGQGTKVTLSLPKSEAANWFLSKLLLFDGQTIVILDDDQSIHDIWNTRFGYELPSGTTIKSEHFFQAEELKEMYTALPEDAQFLVDYELHNNHMTGLDVIKSLGIASRTTLVTSRDEELELRAECAKLGMKILPKALAAYVPFVVLSNKPDLIFIDDNKTLTESWHFIGQLNGKRVLTFNSLMDARKFMPCIPKTTPIYIDSELSEYERGEVYARELYEQGYQELYLATGHPKENFEDCYWFKAIVGKDPVF